MCHASSRRPAKRVWSWMLCPMAPVACGLNPSARWSTSRERRCRSRANLTWVLEVHPVRADWEEAAVPDWEEAALPDWEEAALPDWEEAALLDWEEAALPDWEVAALPDWEVASAVAAGINGGKAHWGWPRAAMDRRAKLIDPQASSHPAIPTVPCRDRGTAGRGIAGAG
jgi:hypothetical protein